MPPYNLYLNGGCYFESSEEKESDVQILGRYSVEGDGKGEGLIDNLNGMAAILEVRVGKGKVLLSGVHFEFHAHKLEVTNNNIRQNVYPKLISNEANFQIHSNEKLFKNLFNRAFVNV